MVDWFSLFTLIRREIRLTGLSDRVGVPIRRAAKSRYQIISDHATIKVI